MAAASPSTTAALNLAVSYAQRSRGAATELQARRPAEAAVWGAGGGGDDSRAEVFLLLMVRRRVVEVGMMGW